MSKTLKLETRYRMQKRIKELKEENDKLLKCAFICREIHAGITEVSGDTINKNWILKKYLRFVP